MTTQKRLDILYLMVEATPKMPPIGEFIGE